MVNISYCHWTRQLKEIHRRSCCCSPAPRDPHCPQDGCRLASAGLPPSFQLRFRSPPSPPNLSLSLRALPWLSFPCSKSFIASGATQRLDPSLAFPEQRAAAPRASGQLMKTLPEDKGRHESGQSSATVKDGRQWQGTF